ncbi:MAG: DUF6340 family protein [Dysgonamonadaceae bacterium]|jgi:hypothetical protein|nr:DUF6340 family protein [Dysgonamonadaceae bacterium]
MKKFSYKILCIICLVTSTSCESIRRFVIEVQEPAAVTFPLSVRNVLVVNNTVPQDTQYGIEQKLDDKAIEKTAIDLDSTVWVVIRSLSKAFAGSDFFDEVFFYNDTIRTDDRWLTIHPLPEKLLNDFYDLEQYDAILSIDRLAFTVKENIKSSVRGVGDIEPLASVNIRTEAVLNFSIYLYGDKEAYKMFSISEKDSLLVSSILPDDSLLVFKSLPEHLIGHIASTLGKRIAAYFIPSWESEERVIYSNHRARMKEARKYADIQNWAEAEIIWTNEYKSEKKNEEKGKLAINIALANEMQDDMETALSWAEKAAWHFEETGKAGNDWLLLAKDYVFTLNERIKNNKLLDLQWGVN